MSEEVQTSTTNVHKILRMLAKGFARTSPHAKAKRRSKDFWRKRRIHRKIVKESRRRNRQN